MAAPSLVNFFPLYTNHVVTPTLPSSSWSHCPALISPQPGTDLSWNCHGPLPLATADWLRKRWVRIPLPNSLQWKLGESTCPHTVKLRNCQWQPGEETVSSERKYSKRCIVQTPRDSRSFFKLDPVFLRHNCIPSLLPFGYRTLQLSDLPQYLSNGFPICWGFLRWSFVICI